jgi:hypothetical protein
MNWPGEIRFLRVRRPCVVADVSSGGASIRADGVPEGIIDVKLVLAGGPPIAATVAWRARGRIGLRFRAEQDWIGAIGAGRFDPAAPAVPG